MKPKMTLDKLAEIIERTVAKKEDIKEIKLEMAEIKLEMATKKDVATLSSGLEDLKVKYDRLDTKVDTILDLVETNEKSHLNLTSRVQKLEKQILATP